MLAGHALYAFDVVGIAFLAASFSESLSTAAIFALAFTLAFWVMDFAATASGGLLHELSFYSLTAALHQFEQGLFNLPAVSQCCLAQSVCLRSRRHGCQQEPRQERSCWFRF